MKHRYVFLVSLLLSMARTLTGQLTEHDLQEAVSNQNCQSLAGALDTMLLGTEEMKFNAAICLFRNGAIDHAQLLFDEVAAMKAQRWKGAVFWKAKIYAAHGKDSMAIGTLQSLPLGFLNYKLLSQPDFNELLGRSNEFKIYKQSFQPGFNVWTGALAFVTLLGFLLGVVLWFGKSKFTSGEKWLSLVAFSFAFILISYLTIWTRYALYFPYLRNTWPFLTLLVGPAVYFYLKATFKEPYSRREVMWHFLLPGISFLLTLPAMLDDLGIPTHLPSDLIMIGASGTVLTGQLLFYTVRIHFMTQNEWQVDANIRTWTRILSLGMKIYTIAFLSYFILVSCSFFNPQWDYAISLVMGAGILLIGYMGLVQKRVFSSEPIETFLPVQKYQNSTLTPAASESIRVKLERLLTEQEVFKENELRLDDLASYLDINRHQLSQVINAHYGVNFFELLNRYRVAYVKKVLADPSYTNYTIIQIAYEAGFNNKASFNRYFKQASGMTPSAYRMAEVRG